ncbi:MAG: squalene/phytoene synthase family protein [Anaerolineales bacterium]|nr:squalene/phytoene synthase family protein [Anaerolineales bacterium]
MQLQHAWERNLLDLAYEALHLQADHPTAIAAFDSELLASAYAYCDTVTAVHSRSFHMASSLLAKDKRKAVRALYAFCRVSDDIVDRTGEGQVERLEAWRRRATAPHPPVDDLVAVAWADARLRYQVPMRYAEQLIDGVARDFTQNRYGTFEELTAYCYGVASTVGLMSMHIIGFSSQEALPYAIKLGVALQLTNILRDVGEDWRAGRLYLPQNELAEFGLDESSLAAGIVTDAWRHFMRFQIERNRRLYDEAMLGIGLLNRDGRFAIGAAAELYRGILDGIEKSDYDVFHHRAFVTTGRKVRMLPGIWWRSQRPAPAIG